MTRGMREEMMSPNHWSKYTCKKHGRLYKKDIISLNEKDFFCLLCLSDLIKISLIPLEKK